MLLFSSFGILGATIYIDVDAKILARGTPGFSGADLQNMVKYVFFFYNVNLCECWCTCSQAAVQASKLHAKEVELAHFEWAKVDIPVMK